MSTIYVRGVKERTYAALKMQAEDLRIPVAEVVRRILDDYVKQSEADWVDRKYRAAVTDLIALYRADLDETRTLLTQLHEVLLAIQEVLHK